MAELRIQDHAMMAERTSLGVGGPVHALVDLPDAVAASRAIDFASRESLDTFVLGGGTNLLVSDAGYEGLVLVPSFSRIQCDAESGLCHAEAGATWNELVRVSVAAELGGLECMAGIPGTVGAAPVQNIGAYGQELSDVLIGVNCVDLPSGDLHRFDRSSCDLSYRSSRFKNKDRGRYLITSVDLQLVVAPEPCLDYAQLRESFEPLGPIGLAEVSERVLELRRDKGMVLEGKSTDLNSAGSFFTNPVLGNAELDALRNRLEQVGANPLTLPSWKVDESRFKCSAAWLIEASGMQKGYGEGPVGLSARHVLAVVNRGGANASHIVDFARSVRDRVHQACGVRLLPEPVPLGFDDAIVDDLWGKRD